MKKDKSKRINGKFYPWLIEMGNSPAFQRLQNNSDAVNVLTMYINKFSPLNDGKNLCVTYEEAGAKGMSASTFAKGKLWCTAFGFLHCREFGRLERKPSIYDISTKWRYLSSRPEKLERIEHLLKKHEVILRIQNIKVQDKNSLPAKVRKKMSLRRIEKEILSQ